MEHQTPKRQDPGSRPQSSHVPPSPVTHDSQPPTHDSQPPTPISLRDYNLPQSSSHPSPYRRRSPFSKARCLAHKLFPAIFFTHFLITGTVVLHYTLVQHRSLPRPYTIGAAIIFGVLIFLISMSNLLLYFRRQYGSDAMDEERSSTSGSGMGSLRGNPRVSPTELEWCKCRLGQWLIRYERKSLGFPDWNARQAKKRADRFEEEENGDSKVIQDERRKITYLNKGHLGAGHHYHNSESVAKPDNIGCMAGCCFTCFARALKRIFISRSQKPGSDVAGSQGSNHSPHDDTMGHGTPRQGQARGNDQLRMSDDSLRHSHPTPTEFQHFDGVKTQTFKNKEYREKMPAAHLGPARRVLGKADAIDRLETRRKPAPSSQIARNIRQQRAPQKNSSRAPVNPASHSQAPPSKKGRMRNPPAGNETHHASQRPTLQMDRNQSSSYPEIRDDRRRYSSSQHSPPGALKIQNRTKRTSRPVSTMMETIPASPAQGTAEKHQGKATLGEDVDRRLTDKRVPQAPSRLHNPGTELFTYQNSQMKSSNVSQEEVQDNEFRRKEQTEDMTGNRRPFTAHHSGAERRTVDWHLMNGEDLSLVEEFRKWL